jgi:glycosyltransferase involved in cell wall biosynthesis
MMNPLIPEFDSLRRIAVIGNYLPRRCGIATFTTDLCEAMAAEAPGAKVSAVAMNDVPEGYPYPPRVRLEVEENTLRDYELAGDFLNMNQFDLVCVQHEYGIFGGDAGSHVLVLLRELRMPIITTLHTVLKDPSDEQRVVLKELGRLSDRLVVMSQTAVQFLREIYNVPEAKIAFIHHGIPDVPFVDPNYYKDLLGVEGRRVILSFGLLSPGKGIEYMIGALPEVVKKYPDAVYIVLGATHPQISRTSGREYRLKLQTQVVELKMQDHVIFHNRFVELEELCEFLGGSDVYVTPYINEAQIVSGTLAYALGSGKAVVSTPYWYAREMLAENRGRLVAFRDSGELAAQCTALFDNEVERHAMRKKAYTYCREMIWKEVARRYLEVFAEARAERRRVPQAFKALHVEPPGGELPRIKLSHLQSLTDDTGMLQHARFTVPDREHGYCTDDNARALVAVLMASRLIPADHVLAGLCARYLSFLEYAFDEKRGRFRNFMTYDRRWIEQCGSEDSHGRSVLGLGMAIAFGRDSGQVGVSMELFQLALPALERFGSLRSLAFGAIGIYYYLKRFHGDSVARRTLEVLAGRVYASYKEHATDDWPWPEHVLAYANAKLPHAMLLSGLALEQPDMTEIGLRSLDWLAHIQSSPQGCFSPVGTEGWYRKGQTKARFDQQPIEAHAMIEASIEAHRLTADERWLNEAWRCFEWFLGRNDLQLPLYDYSTGGCRDGIHPDRVNENQGAESTVSWLLSLLSMYHHRSEIALVEAGQSLAEETAVVTGGKQ